MIPPRPFWMRVSDCWFYLGHPVLWWREIFRPWQAERVGQVVVEI